MDTALLFNVSKIDLSSAPNWFWKFRVVWNKDNKVRTVGEMVRDNAIVMFKKCHDSQLWYETDCGFEFPVPFEDTQGAMLHRTDRAMFFMHWISKHMEMLEREKTKI